MNFSEISHYLQFGNVNGQNLKKIKTTLIPQIIQNLCPWLKSEDYIKLKDNPEFQQKQFLVCPECYFKI